jgi:hypothetical protein
VHRLSPDGKHLQTWGESGSDAGQFNIPHNVAMNPANDGIIVADRENSRVQLFDLDGKHRASWHVHRAVSVRVKGDLVYIAEQGASSRVQKGDGLQVSCQGVCA